jgi:uncharacterized membrane protein (UPF0127 family)
MVRATLAIIVLWMTSNVAIASCQEDTVYLRGEWGQARFSVEIADTPLLQKIGLMNRSSMPSATGMLFVYDSPRALSFWMKNTLIPLDMLFIDSKGVVTHIHHMAKPLNELPIYGGMGIAVLEINGGMAKSLGISVGTELRHQSFQKGDPSWSC